MDEIPQDNTNPQTERDIHLPLSPKRPRIDCSSPADHGGKSRFDFSELLKFRKTGCTQSSAKMLQDLAGLACLDTTYGKPDKQLENTGLGLSPKLATSHSDDKDTGSFNPCCIVTERSVPLVKNEQPPVNETDELSLYPLDNAGVEFAEFYTLKDAIADTSSHPDCNRQKKSLEDEPPCGCNVPAGNDKDRRQVQNSVSQIQVFSLSSSDVELRCLSDCIYEDMLHDPDFYKTWSKSAQLEECNQRNGEEEFTEKALMSKEEAESSVSSVDYADSESVYSIPEVDSSRSMAEGVKNEDELLELQIRESENVSNCDGETKTRVNDNGITINSIPSDAAEWAEGSVVSYDMALVGDIAAETSGLGADDFCGAKEAHAAGQMIAKTESETADHTTETPMPARISQEPAEGDNDAGPFGVIDPAIWSESDREAEPKRCDSESAEGVELSPFIKICEIEMFLFPLVQPQGEGTAREETELKPCPSTTKEIHNNTNNECNYQQESSLSSSQKAAPAGGSTHETSDAPTELDESVCLSDSLDPQEVEYLWAEIADMYGMNETKDQERHETKSNGREEPETSVKLEEKPLQQSEKHKEDTSEIFSNFIKELKEGKASLSGSEIAYAEGESAKNPGCFCDHPYSAVNGRTEEGNERLENDKNDCKESSEMQKMQEDSQQEVIEGSTKGKERLEEDKNDHEEGSGMSVDQGESQQGLIEGTTQGKKRKEEEESCLKESSEMSEQQEDSQQEFIEGKEEEEDRLEDEINDCKESSDMLAKQEDSQREFIDGITEGKEKEESGDKEHSERPAQQEGSHREEVITEALADECIQEQIEAIVSKSGDKLIPDSQHEQPNELFCFSESQHRQEKDDLSAFAFPPSSDAVVPGPQELRHSQNADKTPTTLICSGRFSPVPSAFSFRDHVLGALDTFEKIQLSLDNAGDDESGSVSGPLLTSVLKTPQRQLCHPMSEAGSDECEEGPQEEDKEGKEEDVERFNNTANGLSSCDCSCDELSHFISTADVPAPGSTEQKPNCELDFKSSEDFLDELKPQAISDTISSECDSPASDVIEKPKFEMKKQFDKVLKELNLFFDVSRSEFESYSRESSPEQCGEETEAWGSDASNCKKPLTACEKDASSDDADEVRSLDVCGSDPAVSCDPGRGDGEQEVPVGSSAEVSLYTAEKHKEREPREMEPKRKTWSPSFMCQTFLEQLSHRPPDPTRRLEPLRTCTRPLRVGLSKRAKTKHLHCPHPYK